jgi:hypothetical protein
MKTRPILIWELSKKSGRMLVKIDNQQAHVKEKACNFFGIHYFKNRKQK